MRDLINKPRVFLSHSKKDEEFIKKIFDDLQRCQIAPWLDTFEIRHGKPWLDQIFESGLPTCDSVLIYLTENSINSQVVKKEIDASIVNQLDDNRIAFLPYVSQESLRKELRSDIRALHVPVWNNENYGDVLAASVAEIWHSYLERTVENAVREEKTKRLELELVIEKQKSEGDIFSESENKDFAYIKNQLDYNELMGVVVTKKNSNEKIDKKFEVNILSLMPWLTGKEHPRYHDHLISNIIIQILCSKHITLSKDEEIKTLADIEIGDELLLFGLIQREEVQARPYIRSRSFNSMFELGTEYCYVYTPKMERFKYWLAYNNMFPTEIQFNFSE